MVAVQMGPAEIDLIGIRAGDRNEIQLTVTRAGRPVDLTGAILTAQARRSASATGKLDATLTVTDAVAGKATMAWPGAAVTTWMGTDEHVVGVWDLSMATTGDPITLVAGKLEAYMDVTR